MVSAALQLAGIILIGIVVLISIIGLMVERIDTPKVTIMGAVVAGLIFKFMTNWENLLETYTLKEHIPSNFLEALTQMVDVDVILIIFSVSTIVAVTKRAGFFNLISMLIVKKTKGNPLKLFIALGAFSFLLSMFFDNLSAIIILGSLTVIVCKELELNPQPYILFVGTNTIIGGLPTPVSSLPNLIFYKSYQALMDANPSYQGGPFDLNFLKFTLIMLPAAIIFFGVAVIYFLFLYKHEIRKKMSEEKVEQIERINIWASVKNKKDVIKSITIVVILFTGFVLSDLLNLGMGYISLFVAMLTLLMFNDKLMESIKNGIEWEMIVYYIGLFVLMGIFTGVGSLEPVNILLTNLTGTATKGNLILVAFIVGLIGLPIAGFLDASSAAILFSQIFNKVSSNIGIQGLGFWTSFVFAGNMGGSLSPIGSITILIAIKVLNREGDTITFWEYIKKTLGLTIIHAVLAMFYSFVLIAIGI